MYPRSSSEFCPGFGLSWCCLGLGRSGSGFGFGSGSGSVWVWVLTLPHKLKFRALRFRQNARHHCYNNYDFD
jgi:hypothetical protein